MLSAKKRVAQIISVFPEFHSKEQKHETVKYFPYPTYQKVDYLYEAYVSKYF